MGHIRDRWYATETDPVTGGKHRVRTTRYGKGKRYQVRYLDPDGIEQTASFDNKQKKAAEDFLHKVESDKTAGTYLNVRSGDITFKEYAEKWLAGQTFKGTTRTNVPSRLTSKAYPFLGNYSLSSITPTVIRAWLRWMQESKTAPSYRRVCFVHVSAILTAAVDDRLIATNPCQARSVSKPQADHKKVLPWTDDRIVAVWRALPVHARIIVPLGAGCGLRQGEMFGLCPTDIDRENNLLHIARQIQQVDNKLVYCAPKGDKDRDVPLPAYVLAHLDEYMALIPPVVITLPWDEPSGELVTHDLIVTAPEGHAWWRQTFNSVAWQPSLRLAEVPPGNREDGTHALRHYYASTLLDGGESIKAVSEYLGHSDPGFTLRTYTHLMPSSHERTRTLIDRQLRTLHGPQTVHMASDEENSRSAPMLLRTGSRGRG